MFQQKLSKLILKTRTKRLKRSWFEVSLNWLEFNRCKKATLNFLTLVLDQNHLFLESRFQTRQNPNLI